MPRNNRHRVGYGSGDQLVGVIDSIGEVDAGAHEIVRDAGQVAIELGLIDDSGAVSESELSALRELVVSELDGACA